MQYPGRIVRAGERDAAIVRELKLKLNEVLGLEGCTDLRLDPDDPNFGPKMTSAVKLFQTRSSDEGGGAGGQR